MARRWLRKSVAGPTYLTSTYVFPSFLMGVTACFWLAALFSGVDKIIVGFWDLRTVSKGLMVSLV